jgi:hypothetical protein
VSSGRHYFDYKNCSHLMCRVVSCRVCCCVLTHHGPLVSRNERKCLGGLTGVCQL